jgi:hypothetical protein
LFYLVFELTGTCNQCKGQANFFDAVTTGRRKLDQSSHAPLSSPGFRFLQGETIKCGCPKEFEERSVDPGDFFSDFGKAIEESGLQIILTVKKMEEETKTSLIDAVEDSEIDDESDSPSEFPSTPMPSKVPSVFASTTSSQLWLPTNFRTVSLTTIHDVPSSAMPQRMVIF